MALQSEQRTQLVEIIARVPSHVLLDISMQQRVIADFEELRKKFTNDIPAEARRQVIGLVISTYERFDKVDVLCEALASRLYLDEELRDALMAFVPGPGSDAAKQRAIAKRANTLASRPFRKFMDDVEAKVCIVVAVDGRNPGNPVLGTGFLVAPAMVLTAYHTLSRHIERGTGKAHERHVEDRLYVIFDHYEGQPINGTEDIGDGLLRVDFAKDWLKCCCEDMPFDGQFLRPDPDQLKSLPKSLDFALVELADPVGSQKRRTVDGLQRSWVSLEEATDNLRDDDRIIVPQHPHGQAQRFDIGRYSDQDSQLDTSMTRIRYTTEADEGASGSPCFNQNFRLVGLHNAAFMPGGVVVKRNQAVRADRIRDLIAAKAAEAVKQSTPKPPLWNTSLDLQRPRPILNRETLLRWIDGATGPVVDRAQRLYAALGADHGCGRSFTSEILVAALRSTGDNVVLLGDREQLPATAVDLIRAVGYQLRLPESELATLPPRPDGGLPGGADGDKLRKWASEEVPGWFAKLLAQQRFVTVDRRAAAQQAITALKAAGIQILPKDVVQLAESPEAKMETESKWERIWIVLDGLGSARISEEVNDVIAGLTGSDLEESRVNPELACIRWLFLGYAPDFLHVEQFTPEKLAASSIGADDIVRCAGTMLQSFGRPFALEKDGQFVRTLVDPMLAAQASAVADPAIRLATLQDIARRVVLALMGLVGVGT